MDIPKVAVPDGCSTLEATSEVELGNDSRKLLTASLCVLEVGIRPCTLSRKSLEP